MLLQFAQFCHPPQKKNNLPTELTEEMNREPLRHPSAPAPTMPVNTKRVLNQRI